MTDIFREIEEEVRRERFAQLWKKYGDYIMAAAAVVLLSVAGWQLWTRYEANQNVKSSNAYLAAEQQSGQKQIEAFAKLAESAVGGYAQIARMQEANAMLKSGDRDQALAVYKKLMDGDQPLASVARLRAGWAQAETVPRDDLQKLLAPLLKPDNPWHYAALEVLAYADYRENNTDKALAEFTELAHSTNAPEGIKARASTMAAFLAAGGDKNVGIVPPPRRPAPQPAAQSPASQHPAPK